MSSRSRPGVYRIGAISERFGIHPQTLRLYEREGLLRPARTEGNTRLYDASTIERLEIILTLTRDLGVNLAGVGARRGQIDRRLALAPLQKAADPSKR
jgi:MerR family transcriptional regulator/heat shock protein HspR